MKTDYTTFEQILQSRGELIYTNTGNSMWPLLHQHKDLIVIKPKPEGRLHPYDVAFYKRDNGQYILHRILLVRKRDYIICGDNRYRPEFGISDRHILGVLDSVVQGERTIVVRSTPQHPDVPFLYRLYVHLWCDLFIIRAPLLFLFSRVKKLSAHFGAQDILK